MYTVGIVHTGCIIALQRCTHKNWKERGISYRCVSGIHRGNYSVDRTFWTWESRCAPTVLFNISMNRDRGVGGGGSRAHPDIYYKELVRKSVLCPPPNIESLKVPPPPNLKVAPRSLMNALQRTMFYFLVQARIASDLQKREVPRKCYAMNKRMLFG